MTTWHANLNAAFGGDSLDQTLNKAMNAANLNNHSLLKVVQCGRAVVIIPDSDRTQAAKAGEIMKMLGANERLIKYVRNDPSTIGNAPIEMELPAPAKPIRKDYTFTDTYDDEHYLVRVTNDQLNLLDWLNDRDFLCGHLDWESGHIAHDIEEI